MKNAERKILLWRLNIAKSSYLEAGSLLSRRSVWDEF